MKNNNLTVKEQQANKITPDDIRMKDIPGYEGLYAATSCGKIWSHKANKFVPQWDNGRGYMYVTLRKDKGKKNKRVNVLVALTYLENPDNLPHVEHIDQNPKNNALPNLRWADIIVNTCNRKNNIPIMDLETCEEYCSLSRAAKATKIGRKRIIKDCEQYKETGKTQRFVYLKGLPWETYNKFMWDFFTKRHNKTA